MEKVDKHVFISRSKVSKKYVFCISDVKPAKGLYKTATVTSHC